MTEAEYNRGLRQVVERNPGEVLLPTLRGGYSGINVVYMAAALRRLPEIIEVAETPQPGEPAAPKKADQVLRDLWAERTRLFGEMNKMSNHFHDCTTDTERAENSRAILKKWDEIQAVKGRIKHYEAKGELPEVATDEKYPLPDDPVELMKKLGSIRAMISQARMALREAGQLPNEHPEKQKRIKEGEERLAYLNLYKGHAEQKIRPGIHD